MSGRANHQYYLHHPHSNLPFLGGVTQTESPCMAADVAILLGVYPDYFLLPMRGGETVYPGTEEEYIVPNNVSQFTSPRTFMPLDASGGYSP
jgi:hypothetical protein